MHFHQRRRGCPATLQASVTEPRRDSQVVARLLGGGDLRGATCAPAAEGAARGGGGTTSRELSFVPALGVRAGRSTVRTWPEPTSLSASGEWGRGRRCSVNGQEPPRAQVRRTEHHRDPSTVREHRQPPRQPLAPPRRSRTWVTPRQRRRARPQLVAEPERSTGFWLEHPGCKVPLALPRPDQRT
jgi:hypothetical protein